MRTGETMVFAEIEEVVIRDLSDLDGVVEGTAGADLIDAAYVGDPEGDRIDNVDSLDVYTDQPLDSDIPSSFTEILGGPVLGDNRDAVLGYGGNDTIIAGGADDVVYGGDGDDSLFGGLGDDVLVGDAGDDTLIGGNGINRLFGGEGQDLFIGGEQTDFVYGGAGDDSGPRQRRQRFDLRR